MARKASKKSKYPPVKDKVTGEMKPNKNKQKYEPKNRKLKLSKKAKAKARRELEAQVGAVPPAAREEKKRKRAQDDDGDGDKAEDEVAVPSTTPAQESLEDEAGYLPERAIKKRKLEEGAVASASAAAKKAAAPEAKKSKKQRKKDRQDKKSKKDRKSKGSNDEPPAAENPQEEAPKAKESEPNNTTTHPQEATDKNVEGPEQSGNESETEAKTKGMTRKEWKEAKKLRNAEKRQKEKERRKLMDEAEPDYYLDSADEARKKRKRKSREARKISAGKTVEQKKAEAEAEAADQAKEDNAPERWNVEELEGGAKRQDKFLRLLGGKKLGVQAGKKTDESDRPHLDMTHVSDDLQKQFDSGIRMKYDAGGQRKGLGA